MLIIINMGMHKIVGIDSIFHGAKATMSTTFAHGCGAGGFVGVWCTTVHIIPRGEAFHVTIGGGERRN
jgi:hypothetical protein